MKSPTLKKPEFLPPTEIAAAVRQGAARNIGSTPDEVVIAVARDLGFATATARLKDIIAACLRRLIADGTLVEREHRVYAGES